MKYIEADAVVVNVAASMSAAYVPGGRGAFEIQYQTPGSGVTGDYM